MAAVNIIWDLENDPEGNVQHILEHGLTRDDVEDVLSDSANLGGVSSKTSGNPMAFGWTRSGLHIAVVFEHVDDDPLTVYPLTAYETPPKRRKK